MVTATTPGRGAGEDWARAPAVSKRTAAGPAISLRIGIEYMGCASKRTWQCFAGEGARATKVLVDAGLGERFAGEAPAPQKGCFKLEPKQFAQALGLGAADGNFSLFFVVHSQLVGALEPGHHFLDVIDVDQVRAVGAPEQVGIEIGQ